MSDWFKQAILSVAILGFFAAAPAAAQAPFDPPGLDRAMAAKAFRADALLAAPGVVGVGVGLTASGQSAVVIATEGPGVGGLPRSLDGVPVVIMVTGAFNAINKPDANGNHNHGTEEDPPPDPSAYPCDSDPTNTCLRPVPIGVSTGNGSGASCSAGTISARLIDNAVPPNVYAMSNNHIYALSNSGSGDIAAIGDSAVQAGLFDTNCNGAGNDIGTLYSYVPFNFGGDNYVDVSIALSDTGNLGNATPPSGYGMPSSTTVSIVDALELDVQKHGRTSGLTTGRVTAINFDVRVGYSKGTAQFRDQLIVESFKGAFIKSGDSGSLLVENDGTCGDAADPCDTVGLLFAGNRSGKVAIASPIDLVLDALEGNTKPGSPGLVGGALGTADIDDGS